MIVLALYRSVDDKLNFNALSRQRRTLITSKRSPVNTLRFWEKTIPKADRLPPTLNRQPHLKSRHSRIYAIRRKWHAAWLFNLVILDRECGRKNGTGVDRDSAETQV
jgi:hypothetical protein